MKFTKVSMMMLRWKKRKTQRVKKMNQMRLKKKQPKDRRDRNKILFMMLRKKIKRVRKFLICLG
jgi:hypothetical protein